MINSIKLYFRNGQFVILFFLIFIFFFGCVKKDLKPVPENHEVTGFYKLGHTDGCNSAYDLLGHWKHDWTKNFIYNSKKEYRTSWNDGFLNCLGELNSTEESKRALEILKYENDIHRAQIISFFSLKAKKAISVNPLDLTVYDWNYHHLKSISSLKKKTLQDCKSESTVDNECLVFAANNDIHWESNLAQWEKKYIQNKNNYELEMDGFSNTILHLAALYNRLDYLEKLISRGADINILNDRVTFTPIISAVFYRRYEAVAWLIKNAADINIPDTIFKNTPLIWAVKKDYPKIVKLLLENKADIEFRNKDGKTVFDIAKGVNNKEILKILSDH